MNQSESDVLEFMAQEEGIMNDFAQVLIDRGFEAEWYHNMQGEPTVAVHLVDDEGRKVKYFSCFDVVDEQ